METTKEILTSRDKMSPDEADELIEEMKEQVIRGADPEQVLIDEVGLEPDYIWELFD